MLYCGPLDRCRVQLAPPDCRQTGCKHPPVMLCCIVLRCCTFETCTVGCARLLAVSVCGCLCSCNLAGVATGHCARLPLLTEPSRSAPSISGLAPIHDCSSSTANDAGMSSCQLTVCGCGELRWSRLQACFWEIQDAVHAALAHCADVCLQSLRQHGSRL